MTIPPPRSRVTIPSRLLCSVQRPLAYVNAANTDIRKTFAQYVQPTPASKLSWRS